ncbi:hypothetical protein [Fodinicurvata sp. EGI_FJ10296]|uniref:hypothetical protein n=1 Tax=Fodinicurvata sp. EGI_FJ10296 TaxID=3231908 RepID=UPI003456CB74
MMASPAFRSGVNSDQAFRGAPASRRGWCPSAHRPMESADGWLTRVRPTAGILSADQAFWLADQAANAGSGAMDLTRRANLQIRGLDPAAAADFADSLVAMGLAASSPAAEARRVVLAAAPSDRDPAAEAAVRALATALDDGLRALPDTPAPDFKTLPEKALIVVNGGGRFAFCEHSADLRLDPAGTGCQRQWRLSVNGTRSTATPVAMLPADDHIAARAALDVLSRALTAMPADSGRAGLRAALAALADDMPASALPPGSTLPCSQIGIDCRKNDLHTLIVPGGARPRSDALQTRDLAQQLSGLTHEPGTSGSGSPIGVGDDQGGGVDARKVRESRSGSTGGPTIVPTIGPLADIGLGVGFAFGALDSDMLRALATLARDCGDGTLALLANRTVVLPGAPAAFEHHRALRALADAGAITAPDDPRLGLYACRGRNGCPKGTTDTRADALALAGPLSGYLSAGGRVHVSGCDKACARPAATAGITLTAADGAYHVSGPDAHRLEHRTLPSKTNINGA